MRTNQSKVIFINRYFLSDLIDIFSEWSFSFNATDFFNQSAAIEMTQRSNCSFNELK